MDIIFGWLHNAWFAILLLAFFGFSIFVHELGHYLVARWCGMKIEVFSIGFGPSIWQIRRNGILYKIGIFPIGGYVALPQLDPTGMSALQGETEGPDAGKPLPSITPWKKILVSLAGAAGNVLFAIVLAWLVYLIGMPAGPAERSSTVGYVDIASPAHAAGLRVGDTITAVSGKTTRTWTEVRMEAAFHEAVELTVRGRDGQSRVIALETGPGVFGEQHIPGVDGPSLCLVRRVQPGLTADQAGLKADDLIVRFAGEDIYSRAHLIQLVNLHEDRTVPVEVRRQEGGGDPRLVRLSMTPRRDAELDMVRIGIEFNLAAVEHDTVVRPKPMTQLRSHAGAIFRFLGALGTPKQAKAASNAVGGPVAIIVSYWYIVTTSPMLAIWFTGFLNINLAILNLLPIPVLDGGHICFSLAEMVRRKPVHPRLVNALVNAFAMLLIGLILMLSVRDVDRFTPLGRVIRGWFDGGKPPMESSAIPTPTAPETATEPAVEQTP